MNISDLKIHHIGVAVRSIERAGLVYVENGYVLGNKIFDPVQNVNICFAEKPNEISVELVEPAESGSPVSLIVEKSDATPQVYHICYAVVDLDKTIRDLRGKRWVLVKPPVPARACGNARVAFLYSKEAGLIELLESQS